MHELKTLSPLVLLPHGNAVAKANGFHQVSSAAPEGNELNHSFHEDSRSQRDHPKHSLIFTLWRHVPAKKGPCVPYLAKQCCPEHGADTYRLARKNPATTSPKGAWKQCAIRAQATFEAAPPSQVCGPAEWDTKNEQLRQPCYGLKDINVRTMDQDKSSLAEHLA